MVMRDFNHDGWYFGGWLLCQPKIMNLYLAAIRLSLYSDVILREVRDKVINASVKIGIVAYAEDGRFVRWQ